MTNSQENFFICFVLLGISAIGFVAGWYFHPDTKEVEIDFTGNCKSFSVDWDIVEIVQKALVLEGYQVEAKCNQVPHTPVVKEKVISVLAEKEINGDCGLVNPPCWLDFERTVVKVK